MVCSMLGKYIFSPEIATAMGWMMSPTEDMLAFNGSILQLHS